MLSISELANLAGVTPRAIRHYHRVGVLAEPPRRANGYRSYGPAHLVRLVQIRRMQDLGLSLAEIGDLAEAPADARDTLLALDEDLARQQRELHRRREAIATVLTGPGDLTLPAELASLLDRAAQLGLPPDAIRAERDTLALVVALHPELIPALVGLYREALQDGPMLALVQRFARLGDLAPDDPAVDALAAELAPAMRRHAPGSGSDEHYPLMVAHLEETLTPAQQRCVELIGEEFA